MPKTTKTTPIYKRCLCSPRRWNECDHPWQFEWFHQKTAQQYGSGKHRYSLSVLAKARGVEAPTTRDAAASLADALKIEIRNGTFVPPRAPVATRAIDPAALTVRDVAAQYLVRHVQQPDRRVGSQREMTWMLDVICRTTIPGAHAQMIPFGDKPIKDIVRADVEALRTARRTAHATIQRPTGGAVGLNRMLGRLRHLCSWAVIEGFLEQTPFRRGGIAIVKLTTEQPRDRRLGDGEEAQLLAAAGRHLHDLIVAALATACRRGELLSLQWKDIEVTTTATGQTRQTIVLHAAKTKTATRRKIPVGHKLAAILAMRRSDPDGRPFPPTSYVFGNEVGEPIANVKKTWMTTTLKAHGIVPQWVKGSRNQLSAESRAAYRAIDLHFHDLRREAASRMLEAGVPLTDVRDILGHSNIAQTSTYLKSTATSLASAIEKTERHQQQLAEARAAQPPAPAPVLTPPSTETIQ